MPRRGQGRRLARSIGADTGLRLSRRRRRFAHGRQEGGEVRGRLPRGALRRGKGLGLPRRDLHAAPQHVPAPALQGLRAEHGLMQITGVDINSPRQSFNCPELRRPEFSHLGEATWALVAHERLSSVDPRAGLFAEGGPLRLPLPRRADRGLRAGRPSPRSLAARRSGKDPRRSPPRKVHAMSDTTSKCSRPWCAVSIWMHSAGASAWRGPRPPKRLPTPSSSGRLPRTAPAPRPSRPGPSPRRSRPGAPERRGHEAGEAPLMPGCILRALGRVQRGLLAGMNYDEARRRAERRDSSPTLVPPRCLPGRRPSAGPFSARPLGRASGRPSGPGHRRSPGLRRGDRPRPPPRAPSCSWPTSTPRAARLSESLNAEAGRTVALRWRSTCPTKPRWPRCSPGRPGGGGVDLVVSNAGVLKALRPRQDLVLQVRDGRELHGLLPGLQARGLVFRRQSRTARPGRRTSSRSIRSRGWRAPTRTAPTRAPKFGGIGLVQSFALELVEWRIKVNAICPGNFFDGPLWSDPTRDSSSSTSARGRSRGPRTVADVKAAYEAKVPMGRGCEGPDVMRAIYYLVEQEYETGQALPVTVGKSCSAAEPTEHSIVFSVGNGGRSWKRL